MACQQTSGSIPPYALSERALDAAEDRHDTIHYIEIFCNRKRLHSALGSVSPARFEQSLKVCVN
jgi:hypothetical protein